MTTPSDRIERGRSPFDGVAAKYDAGFGGWPASRLFRFRLIDRIERSVPRGSRLLDVGSGSGEDAVWLASLGFKVVGIDPSEGMVEVARAKAVRTDSAARFERADLQTFTTDQIFDSVYSDFGAMNCVPVGKWAEPLSRLVRPGGKVFLVLMGRRPLPEFLRAGPSAWKRRREPEAPVGEGRSIPVSYPGPGEIEASLGSAFRVERTETFGALVPPPGMAAWPRRNPILFGLLAAMELIVSRRRALCSFSDHFLIELTRRSS